MALIAVADLHVNSMLGLWPPGFVLETGGGYELNPFQKWLWECWKDFIKKVPKGSTVVINGDWLHGIHPRKDSAIISVSAKDMRRAAVAVVEPLVSRARTVYVIRGTTFHGGTSEEDTETVAKDIGAQRDRLTGQYSRWELWKDYEGLLFHFVHHIGVAPVYPLTPMQRALTEAKILTIDSGYLMPDVMVRSHRHQFKPHEDHGRYVFVTPCWQLKTDYVWQRHPMSLPDIGGMIFNVHAGKLTWECPLYPVARPAVVKG